MIRRRRITLVVLAVLALPAAPPLSPAQPYAISVVVGASARIGTDRIAAVPISCAATRCAGTLALATVSMTGAGGVVLGAADFAVPAAQRETIDVQLTPAAMALVLAAPAQRLRVRAVVAMPGPYAEPYILPIALTLIGPESPYENPLRAARHLDPGRIDEGVDYHGDGPVMAIGPGIVTEASTHSRFFGLQDANNTVYRLTAGSLAGHYVYVGEACIPRVHVGDRVTSQTEVCRMFGDEAYPGIEIGLYAGPHDQSFPLAAVLGTYTRAGYPDGTETGCGVAMSWLLAAIGAPAGNTTLLHPHRPPYVSTHLGRIIGSPAACLRAHPHRR